jgi:drug/metabolite transporter (DMT)-like permease
VSGSIAAGVTLAAICALGTNLGWLIKHRGARSSARMTHRHPWRSVRSLLASRAFAAGLVIASAAGLLHIAALALAPISIVQAVMAGGVVILAVLAEPLSGWRVTPRQWSGVILSAGGLVLLTVTLPTISGPHDDFSPVAMTSFELVAGAFGGLMLIAPRVRRLAAHDGALIGAASGVLFGIADLAVKALLGVAHAGPIAVLLSPWLLVAVAAGVLAQYISARSLQTGDAVSVTAMTAVTVNILNICGGILIFGDPLARGLLGTLAESAAFCLICAAAFLTPAPEPQNAGAGGAVTA